MSKNAGHAKRGALSLMVGLILLGGFYPGLAQTFTDTGFTSELVTAVPAYGPVGVAWAPDGRLFIWQKNGVVRIFKNGVLLGASFLDFSAKINIYNDNGMMGLAFDPNFAANRYIYINYVREQGSNPSSEGLKMARLVRVTASAANPDLMQSGSEVVLLDNLPVAYGTHSLGTIRFGPDGKLFVGNGDGASPSSQDDDAWGAQELNNVRGKIFRLNPDGTAPGDNPFDDGTDSIRSRVWCYGVRNPYRFSLHPVTRVPYFADVGWNSWEEIDRGVRGGNYGWPCYEGTRTQSEYQSGLSQCAGLSPVIRPIYEYSHSSEGTCIVGGDFYTGTQYPETYLGNYFYADYSGNWIRRLVLNANGDVLSSPTFATGAGAPTCIEQGPDGLLYLVSFARGEIRRIRFNGPSAVASANPTYGLSPLAVSFSSAGSANGGGGSLAYLWEFGDGTRSTSPNPAHTYTVVGTRAFDAKLTVTNASRLTSSASVRVTVGSVPPTPNILTPADQTGVLPGETVVYRGSANDSEDGPLAADALAWTVLLHHNSHVHAFAAGTGTGGTFQAENHGSIGSFSYEIVLTAIDSSGLTASRSVHLPVLADTIAPTATGGLTAAPAGSRQIRLLWQAASDNAGVASYSVERCRGAGCSDFALVTAVTGTNYDDAGLEPTNTYRYRVRALDATGNAGGYSGVAQATTFSPPPTPPGLIAAFAFDEGSGVITIDATGNGNTGALQNVSWSTAGKFGRALSFSGDGMVTVSHSSVLALSNAMTLEAWVYPTESGGSWKDILFKTTDIYYLVGASSQSGYPATGGTFSSSPLFGNALLPVNTWSHLASTYDGATLRLYVNGLPVASRAQTGSIRSSTGALTIGGDTVYGQFWEGLIDEIRIYNRTLTASQIQNDMTSPVDQGGSQPPVAMANASPRSGQVPLLVTFSSAGSVDPEGAPLSYYWNFGDGNSSASAGPSHTYHAAGVFVAQLTVSDGITATLSSNLTITATNAPIKSAPIISDLPDQSVDEDATTGPLPFTVSDADTPANDLLLSANSSNPSLIPVGNVVLGGSGTNRTVSLTPAGQTSGTATITLTVSDGMLAASDSFIVTVQPVAAILAIVGRDDEGRQVLRVEGRQGREYLVEASEDLSVWTTVGSVRREAEPQLLTDPGSVTRMQRFYRAKAVR